MDNERINCKYCNMPIKNTFDKCPFCKADLFKKLPEDMPDFFKNIFGGFDENGKKNSNV